MLSVHQHWDPLKVCAVGRCYPPEYFNYIQNLKVRGVFHRIAEETEEDYQKLISLLEKFDVSLEEAQDLVMTARVMLGWVNPDDLTANTEEIEE